MIAGVTSKAGFCTTIKSKDSLDRFCTDGCEQQDSRFPTQYCLGTGQHFSTCRSLSNEKRETHTDPHGPTCSKEQGLHAKWCRARCQFGTRCLEGTVIEQLDVRSSVDARSEVCDVRTSEHQQRSNRLAHIFSHPIHSHFHSSCSGEPKSPLGAQVNRARQVAPPAAQAHRAHRTGRVTHGIHSETPDPEWRT